MVNQEQSTTRPNLDLERLGLRLGDVLSLIDESEITRVVVALSPPRVLHDGEVKSLTAACNEGELYRILPAGLTFRQPAGKIIS